MENEMSRRRFVGILGSTVALPLLARAGSASLSDSASSIKIDGAASIATAPTPTSAPATNYVPVVTPGIATLPFTMNNGVKEFQLTAGPVTFALPDLSDGMGMRGRPVNGFGYNGSTIGPTIEAVEGDTVRIILHNQLPEPTTLHFHGIELPIQMDGVPLFSQDPIPPGGSFVYEFKLNQSGTYFYHSHFMTAKQVGLGLMGFFIIHPQTPSASQVVDKDYAFFLHTWKINPGSAIPDTVEMNDFNFFTMNGRVGNGVKGWEIPPMKAKIGERVRIRVTNLSMLTHPVHLHGHTFRITEWGGGFLPEHQQIRANTINISSAEVRTLEFVARAPGKWMFHCHFTHHTMNDMHRPPLPGDPPMSDAMMAMMDMGGMSTWIEITA
jgi:FtsP/CotA-like multicopper oxidase with cupredoxin domain